MQIKTTRYYFTLTSIAKIILIIANVGNQNLYTLLMERQVATTTKLKINLAFSTLVEDKQQFYE